MELSTGFLELNFDMELLSGINIELASWSVVVLSLVVPVIDGVLDAKSTVLTVGVVVTIAPCT